MARRKLTPIQRKYRKERRRIQNAIKRLEKQGYVLTDGLLPSVPKRVTQASINRLKKITIEAIYKKSVRLDVETGEITPGIVARDKARSQRAKKAARKRAINREYTHQENYAPPPEQDYSRFPSWADIVLSNFESDVIRRFPLVAGPILEKWLTELLSKYDKEDVAEMLEKGAENGVFIDYKVAYRAELVMGAIAEFMEYLPIASGYKQDIMDAMEFEEDWEIPD